jgi:sterol 3beta-glucosyltransferase
MKKARADDKPLVYCGFGSITIPDPAALTQAVIESVKAADVRMILAKGWSARRSADRTDTIALPDTIYQIDAIPHEWLFKQVDACIHHGGSGTTAAALRFGVPCGIKPFFGDQQ